MKAKNKSGIIIQARMSSTRLPGKVMKKLAGREVIWHDVERCRLSQEADLVVVATSNEMSDDILVDYLKKHQILYWRGSLENVLSRYAGAAEHFGLDLIARITADCPLTDPETIDKHFQLLRQNLNDGIEYVSNIAYRVFPAGLDCEVFTRSALAHAAEVAQDNFDREHVTPYLMRGVKYRPYIMPKDLQGDERLTLDEIADYNLLSKIYSQLYQKEKIIDVRDALSWLRTNQELLKANSKVTPKHVGTDDRLFQQNPHYIDIYRQNL